MGTIGNKQMADVTKSLGELRQRMDMAFAWN
jgi:hypothetical protein